MKAKLHALVALGILLAWTLMVSWATTTVQQGDWHNPSPYVWLWRQLVPELFATYIPTPVLSVQRGYIDLASLTTNTATITSVTTTSAAIHFTGNRNNDASVTPNENLCRVELTNATTVTAKRGQSQAAAQECGYEVINYIPQFVRNVQRFTIDLNNVTSNTATITSVVTNHSELSYLGTESSQSATTPDYYLSRLILTNSTTVTASVYANGGAVAHKVGGQVFEWK